jgi:threonine dehydratase
VDQELVGLAEIRAAARRLAGVAVRTPLLPAPWDGVTGGRLWLKPENLQPVGAFKLRGAYHALSRLDLDARRAGVITHSSGNHGRALAYAAALLRVPAVIVMPNVSPQVKIDAVEALGAEVRLVEPAEREHVTRQLAAERGLSIVPPYDHRDIIAGQGTVGLEILEDLPEVDVILVPVGGGGLASGVATAAKALKPTVKVVGVEPALAADARDSLAAGQLRAWPVDQTYRTSADGLRTNLSPLTFAHLRARLDGIVTVAEDEIGATVSQLARHARLVVEPSGAVAVAACLYHRDQLTAGRTVAILSGGNLEPALLAQLITADPSEPVT